jgi:hypothetical protein
METRLLIRGEQVEGAGAPLAVENPATEERLVEVRSPSQAPDRKLRRGRLDGRGV